MYTCSCRCILLVFDCLLQVICVEHLQIVFASSIMLFPVHYITISHCPAGVQLDTCMTLYRDIIIKAQS